MSEASVFGAGAAQILSLSDAEASFDGGEVAFSMNTTAGAARLLVPAVEIGDIMSFFATCASATGDRVAEQGRPAWPLVNDLVPIPATGIGFQAGTSPDTTLLVMNLSGFGLAFEIESSGLVDLADQLGQIARTLSVRSGPRN